MPVSPIAQTLAERAEALRLTLVQARGEFGLTQPKLAEMAGIRAHIISNYENGRMPFYSTPPLVKLCDALGIDLSEYGYETQLVSNTYKFHPRVHRVAKHVYAHQAFGSRMKSVRLARGLTQEVLAEMLDMSIIAVTDWERGNRMPRETTLTRWCSVLGEDSYSWLVARAEEIIRTAKK